MAAPTVELVRGTLSEVADADVLAVPVSRHEQPVPGAGADEVADAYGVDLADELRRAKASASPGEIVPVPIRMPGATVEQLLLVGTGSGTPQDLRRAGAALARRVRDRASLATTLVTDADPVGVRAAVEGMLLASYSFTRKSGPPKSAPVGAVHLAGSRSSSGVEDAVRRARVTARAVHRARDLTNAPANEKDPAWLAARADELGSEAGLEVEIRDEARLAVEGWGGVLAVGMGSASPPRVIELRYTPETTTRRTPHVVLIGKGITFDTGGLSLKRPYDAMVAMRTDMAGGGAVIAAMTALAELGVRARVTGIVPAAENMPSGSAQRPGDVITQYGGRTVEVMNTDAEGRLVLADALAYADRDLAPDVVVDVATLTGAASLGLGRRHGALYTDDDRLAAALVEAGEASGDRLWRMPLVEDYRFALESPVADLCHVATDEHISGGSITAALFLKEFAGRRRWAHLDIAGPARSDGEEHEVTKGGTGFGTRLLLRWLEGMR